jgi:hypothetical protein
MPRPLPRHGRRYVMTCLLSRSDIGSRACFYSSREVPHVLTMTPPKANSSYLFRSFPPPLLYSHLSQLCHNPYRSPISASAVSYRRDGHSLHRRHLGPTAVYTSRLAYDPSVIRSLLLSHWSMTQLWMYTNTAALANDPPVSRLSKPSCRHINRLCSGHQHRRLIL